MGMRVAGPFPLGGPRAAFGVLPEQSARWEGDGGEVRPVSGDSSVHPPGRAVPLAVTSARHRRARGLEMMGWASVGLCSCLQGRAGPAGLTWGGDFVPPMLRQRFWRGLRDTVAVLKEAAASLL